MDLALATGKVTHANLGRDYDQDNVPGRPRRIAARVDVWVSA